MANPDLFERARNDIGSLNPEELYVVGSAFVDTFLQPEFAQLPRRNNLLRTAMGLTAQGLSRIRTDDSYTEGQRLAVGMRAFFRADWELLPDSPEKVRLFGEAFYTLGAGLKTPIGERIGELREELIHGFGKLAAILHLNERIDRTSPLEQVQQLYESPTLASEEQRRAIALAWASKYVSSEEHDQDDYFAILGYFMDKEDGLSVAKLAEMHVRAFMSGKPSENIKAAGHNYI